MRIAAGKIETETGKPRLLRLGFTSFESDSSGFTVKKIFATEAQRAEFFFAHSSLRGLSFDRL